MALAHLPGRGGRENLMPKKKMTYSEKMEAGMRTPVSVALNAGEIAVLDAAADILGIGRGEFIRQTAITAAETVIGDDDRHGAVRLPPPPY